MPPMTRRAILNLAIFAAAIGALLPGVALGATTHALLIGVSSYPSLPADRQLRGPRNDVLMLRDTLSRAGVPERNILVLADGVAGAQVPTRAAILNGFAL